MFNMIATIRVFLFCTISITSQILGIWCYLVKSSIIRLWSVRGYVSDLTPNQVNYRSRYHHEIIQKRFTVRKWKINLHSKVCLGESFRIQEKWRWWISVCHISRLRWHRFFTRAQPRATRLLIVFIWTPCHDRDLRWSVTMNKKAFVRSPILHRLGTINIKVVNLRRRIMRFIWNTCPFQHKIPFTICITRILEARDQGINNK